MTSSRKNKERITSVLGQLFPSVFVEIHGFFKDYLSMKKNCEKANAHLEGADPLSAY